MLIPPGYVRLAVASTGLALFAVALAVMANLLGLTGFPVSKDTVSRMSAIVSVGAPCDRSGAGERVRFSEGGREREVRFDGCGHAKGERVEISVPSGGGNAVAYATGTEAGDGERGESLGTLLLLTASAAGAVYAYLLRRAPRVQPTSPAGASQVLH